MDKRPIGYVPGKGNPLDKKPPKTHKYDKIGPTVNSGNTVKDISVVSDNLVAKRKNELFKRIKASTVANLIKQEHNFESIYKLNENQEQEEQKEENIQNFAQIPDDQSVYSMRSNQTGTSEASKISAVTYATEQLGITDDTCFLLLDLREPEDFDLYHIKESINFPAPNIGRDKFIPQIYRFKNKEQKLIIIYHFDERQSIPLATQMGEKGFDNVYLISGGIEKFVNEFTELIEGKKVPVVQKPADKSKSSSGKKVIQKRSNYMEQPQVGNVIFKNENQGDKDAQSIVMNSSKVSKTGSVSNIDDSDKISKKSNNKNF